MIQSVFTIGIVLTVALLILSLILLKATPKEKYIGYFPAIISFAAGLILLLFATLLEKADIMGAGFGGWGIACLFASAVSLIITAVADSYQNAAA